MRLTSSNVSHALPTSNDSVFLNIVPVRVTAGDTELLTHAFLDQGSTTTPCCRKLLERLNVVGDDASYIVTTIKKTSQLRKEKKVKLQIASVEDGDPVELPNVYSIKSLPIAPNNAFTTEELPDWPPGI